MIERILLAFLRFYEHNDPLVFLVPLIAVSFFWLLVKPKRRLVLLLLGLILLLLEFEYSKVIFREFKSDWLNQVFSTDFRFRKYVFATLFFQSAVPFLMSLLGWVLIALAAFI